MSQIRLRILGESVIQVGETIVEPSATHLFALLLYVAIERGKLIPRGQLASMLFPEASATNAAHNLRQLLYRLRRMGVPLETTAAAVRLPAESVIDGPESALTRGYADSMKEDVFGLVLLPSYSPPTPPLSRWIESYRDEISGKLLRRTSRNLARAREGADWTAVERFARALLGLDPLNETATLGLAEAMARSGSKYKAVKMLHAFADDVGRSHGSIALPSRVLKRRISEDSYTISHRGPFSTLIGRTEPLRQLTEAWKVARAGRLTVIGVTGEPSIGKTRVLEEFLELVRLDGTGTTLSLRALPGDRDRPMSLFSDICRQLLQLPGAAGCSPDNLLFAKRLSDASRQDTEGVREMDAGASERSTRRALLDLLECVAAERPLTLSIDDAHHLDDASKSFLSTLSELAPSAPAFFLLASCGGGGLSLQGRTIRLGPLNDETGRTLAQQLCIAASYDLSTESRAWCVAAAAGNPGHLALLLQHTAALGDTPAAPPGLIALLDARIASLAPAERHVLQACAIFGSECCPTTIAALTGLEGYDLLLTLERLSEGGLATDSQSGIGCRSALLADRVLESTSQIVRTLLHQRAAAHLEQFAGNAPTSQALAWRIANHWQAAGERARTLEWRRVCWHQSLSIGQPFAAVDAIRSQLAASNAVRERAALLDDLALALHSAGDWSRLLTTLEERRSLSETIADDSVTRLALSADVIEARRQAYDDITPLVDDLRALIRFPQLDHERRLRAARTLVIAADSLLDPQLALEAVEAVSATPQTVMPAVTAQQALLIYHAVFGDRDTALALAESLEASASLEAVSARAIAILTNTLHARRIVEAGETNYQHVTVLYDKCVAASMTDGAMRVAARIGNFLAEDGDFDQAIFWSQRAEAGIARSDEKHHGCEYLSLEFDLALLDDNLERAQSLLDSALRLFPPYASPRFAKERLVNQVRLMLRINNAPIEEPMVLRLLEGHDRAKKLGRHDDHMEALWGALNSVGRAAEASRLLEEYVLASRRERRRLNYWLATRTAADPFWRSYRGGLLPKQSAKVTRSVEAR